MSQLPGQYAQWTGSNVSLASSNQLVVAKAAPTVGPVLSDPKKIVKLIVDQEEVLVHEDVLCHYSGNIEGRLQKSNKPYTAGMKQYKFSKVNNRFALKLFVQWLYTQTFDGYMTPEAALEPPPQFQSRPQKESHNAMIDVRQGVLAQLWVLAAELSISELQNIAILQLQRSARKHWRLSSKVIENNQVGAKDSSNQLRRAAMDIAACLWVGADDIELDNAARDKKDVYTYSGQGMESEMFVAMAKVVRRWKRTNLLWESAELFVNEGGEQAVQTMVGGKRKRVASDYFDSAGEDQGALRERDGNVVKTEPGVENIPLSKRQKFQ